MKNIILTTLISISFAFSLPVFAKDESTKKTSSSASKSSKSSKSSKKVKKDDGDFLKRLDYPELQVVPRASERLRIEAKAETSNWWRVHWPLQASSLATLLVGATASSYYLEDLTKDTPKRDADAKTAGTAAMISGTGWLIGSVAIGFMRPYKTGLKQLKKYSGKDKRSQLMKERLAEETLEKAARLMQTINLLSFTTNFLTIANAGAYLDSKGQMIAGMAAILTFAPWVFKDRFALNYEKHLEYKKKIYAPVAYMGIGHENSKKGLYPKLNVQWTF